MKANQKPTYHELERQVAELKKQIENKNQEIASLKEEYSTATEELQALVEELQLNEEKYRSLIDNSIDAVVLTDETGAILEWNKAMVNLTGIKPEEAQKKKIWELQYNMMLPEHKTNAICETIKQKFSAFYNTLQINFPKKQYETQIIGNGMVKSVLQSTFAIRTDKGYRLASIIRDITTRKNAEERLQKREEQYRFVTERIDVFLYMTNPAGEFIFTSGNAQQLFGISSDEIKSNTIYEIFDIFGVTDQLKKQILEKTQRAIAKHKKHTLYEFPITINERHVWVKINEEFIYDQNGDIESIVGMVQNVTIQKQMEQAIKESKEKYRLLVENSNDIITVFYSFDLVYVSPQVKRILGYEPEEFLYSDHWKLIHPDDQSKIKKTHEKQTENRIFGDSPVVYRQKHKKGHYIWVETSGATQKQDDGVIVTICNTRDITQRRNAEQALLASEEKFRTLVENQGEGIAITNHEEIFVFANPAAEHIFGVSSGGLENKSLREFVSHETLEKILYQSKLRKQGKKTTYDIEIIQPSGKKINILVTATPQVDEQKNYTGTFGIFRDITELKKAEQTLRYNTNKLQELNATKDRLFAIISHDLKGPVHNIIGLSELIERNYEKCTEEKNRKFNSLIYQSARSLSVLLENLLEWSRSQRNKIVFQPEMVYIHSIVDICFELFRSDAHKKQIRLENYIPEQTMVFIDNNMITTVIRNLISNAVKFTPAGGTIQLQCSKDDNDLTITVTDTGVGIKPDRINKLFNLAENESTTGTDGEKGTGLGLIICKEFVEKNNGRIHVESEPGKGTTFYITLPAKPTTPLA